MKIENPTRKQIENIVKDEQSINDFMQTDNLTYFVGVGLIGSINSKGVTYFAVATKNDKRASIEMIRHFISLWNSTFRPAVVYTTHSKSSTKILKQIKKLDPKGQDTQMGAQFSIYYGSLKNVITQ